LAEVFLVALLGLATTSSSIVGAALGLYVPLSKRLLACVLAFAAGGLISALAIDLAYSGALALHELGFDARSAWMFVGGGFAVGATIYYVVSRFLERQGAAVRYPTRFREFAQERRQKDAKELIRLLSRGDLLRHLPPEEIEVILPCVRSRRLAPGEIVFRAGDPGDALYIVARGKVDILAEPAETPARTLASLGEGEAFGEMALLTGGPRTATVRSAGESELLAIGREDFERLIAQDRVLAQAVEKLSHERALTNLSSGGPRSASWARARRSGRWPC